MNYTITLQYSASERSNGDGTVSAVRYVSGATIDNLPLGYYSGSVFIELPEPIYISLYISPRLEPEAARDELLDCLHGALRDQLQGDGRLAEGDTFSCLYNGTLLRFHCRGVHVITELEEASRRALETLEQNEALNIRSVWALLTVTLSSIESRLKQGLPFSSVETSIATAKTACKQLDTLTRGIGPNDDGPVIVAAAANTGGPL